MSLYLHATINVVDIPAGSGIAAQDQIAHAAPNGLTIGYFDTGSDYSFLLNDSPGLNFNVEREVLLGGIVSSPSILATTSTSPFTSFSSLLHSDPSSMKVLGVQAGTATDETKLFFEVYGLSPDYILSYANTNALVTGFLRGDGNIVTTGPSQFTAQITAHTVRVLVVFMNKKLPTTQSWAIPLTGTPTVSELLVKYPPKTAHERKIATYFTTLSSLTNIMVGTPTKTPPDEVSALAAAVRFAVHSAPVRNELANRGSTWGWISGSAEKLAFVNAEQHLTAIQQAIGL